MPSKAKGKQLKGEKFVEKNGKSEKTGAGAKLKKKTTETKSKQKAALQNSSSNLVGSLNNSTDTKGEKNHNSKDQSKHKGKKPTKIHAEVQLLVNMLAEKLKTYVLTPASDYDTLSSGDETELTSSDSSSDSYSSDDCSCSSDDSDSSDSDTSSSSSTSSSSYSSSSTSSSSSSSSSLSSSSSSPSSTCDSSSESVSDTTVSSNTSKCSGCNFSDISIVVARLQKKPLKTCKPSSIKQKVDLYLESIENRMKLKSADKGSLKGQRNKPELHRKIKSKKTSNTKKETKSHQIIKSDLPSTSSASRVRLKHSPKNINLNYHSGKITIISSKIEPLSSPNKKKARHSNAQYGLPKANSTFKTSLE